MNVQDLTKQIKRLEKDTMVLQRLFFIKHRYDGKSVKEAANLVGASKNTGYIWQERWNEKGYEGLIPQFAGGRLAEKIKALEVCLIQLHISFDPAM